MDGGQFNGTAAAGTANSHLVGKITEVVVESLPAKYEVPVRSLGKATDIVTGALFSEASQNEARSDAKRETEEGCGN